MATSPRAGPFALDTGRLPRRAARTSTNASQGRLPVSRWTRTLATCSIQHRAWALSASRELICRPFKKFFWDIADRVLDTPFFISPPDITRHRLEAVVCGKIQITRIKDRSATRETLQYSRLKIVVHNAPSARTKIFQRVAVGGQEAFHTLAQEELHEEQPAITEHRSEVMEFARTAPDAHQAVRSPSRTACNRPVQRPV
jgi:hypothetical protein